MRSIRVDRPVPYPPRINEATRPFWEALRGERFVTTRCQDCSDMAFPPKVVCANCLSDHLVWVPLSGRGTLYSYTRVWAGPKVFADDLPYTLCVVDLDEGLRVGSRLLEDGDKVQVERPVSLVLVHYSDVTLFCFELDRRPE